MHINAQFIGIIFLFLVLYVFYLLLMVLMGHDKLTMVEGCGGHSLIYVSCLYTSFGRSF